MNEVLNKILLISPNIYFSAHGKILVNAKKYGSCSFSCSKEDLVREEGDGDMTAMAMMWLLFYELRLLILSLNGHLI